MSGADLLQVTGAAIPAARRAKTSVGSLYQFFPNKEAILAALTEHYLGEIRAVHAVVLSAEAA